MVQLQLHNLSCVPDTVKDNERYVGDHVIRYYQDKTIEELFTDLGIECPDTYTVHGGIGTLTLTKQGNTFVSSLPDLPPTVKPPPLTAEQVAERRVICTGCDKLKVESDSCSMCGCGAQLANRTQSPFASCPLRKWPVLQIPNPM